jgi:hypothetical protein
VIKLYPEKRIDVQLIFCYDEDASELAETKPFLSIALKMHKHILINCATILTSEGTTGVPAGAADDTLPATTASLALTVKRHGSRRCFVALKGQEEKLKMFLDDDGLRSTFKVKGVFGIVEEEEAIIGD